MASSGLGEFGSLGLNAIATEDEEPELNDEQFVLMEEIRDVTVVLSERTWKVVFEEEEIKFACAMAPPGRLELLGSPYCPERRQLELNSFSNGITSSS